MDEVNRSEFLQHLLIQGDVMSRSEIMGQIGEIARKIMDIEDDNYSFFESAGMRYSFPMTDKSDSPYLQICMQPMGTEINTQEKQCNYHLRMLWMSFHPIFSQLVKSQGVDLQIQQRKGQ